jgi:branched-chain amino acid transport system substrate-binding protein
LSYVLRGLAPVLAHVRNGGRRHDVTVAVRDSRSDPDAARQAVRDLADTDGANLVLTMAGTRVLPAVADACEEARVPCVSTTFTWQAYVDARVATLVYWSPGHPYRSSLDGTTCAELAHAYRQATGAGWLQPLGLAHALVETAHHALTVAADPTDRASVAQALAGTTLDTIAGTLDWTRGPTPNIALLPLVGGQWQHGPGGPRLAVVSNTALPGVPLTGELTPAR